HSRALDLGRELFGRGSVHLDRFLPEEEVHTLSDLLGTGAARDQVTTVASGTEHHLQGGALLTHALDNGKGGVGGDRCGKTVDSPFLHGQHDRSYVGAPEGKVGVEIPDLEARQLC